MKIEMINFLDILEKQRNDVLKLTENISTEQYIKIPAGSNNNIIWNLGHSLVITDSILYRGIQLECPIYSFEIENFNKDRKPESTINAQDISLIRQALTETAPQLRKVLINPNELMTNDNTLHFILFHENMHFAKIQKLLLNTL